MDQEVTGQQNGVMTFALSSPAKPDDFFELYQVRRVPSNTRQADLNTSAVDHDDVFQRHNRSGYCQGLRSAVLVCFPPISLRSHGFLDDEGTTYRKTNTGELFHRSPTASMHQPTMPNSEQPLQRIMTSATTFSDASATQVDPALGTNGSAAPLWRCSSLSVSYG